MRVVARDVALGVFALVHLVVVAGPAVVLSVAADKGGVPGAHGTGLLVTSATIGVAHAFTVWLRLRRELRSGAAAVNASVAAFDALVVLALMVTGLLFVFLGGYAPFAAVLVNRGWPVVALWAVVQLTAVVAAELVRSLVLRWLRG